MCAQKEAHGKCHVQNHQVTLDLKQLASRGGRKRNVGAGFVVTVNHQPAHRVQGRGWSRRPSIHLDKLVAMIGELGSLAIGKERVLKQCWLLMHVRH